MSNDEELWGELRSLVHEKKYTMAMDVAFHLGEEGKAYLVAHMNAQKILARRPVAGETGFFVLMHNVENQRIVTVLNMRGAGKVPMFCSSKECVDFVVETEQELVEVTINPLRTDLLTVEEDADITRIREQLSDIAWARRVAQQRGGDD